MCNNPKQKRCPKGRRWHLGSWSKMSRQVYLHLSCGSQIFEASLHLWKRNFPSIQIYKWMKPYHSTSLLAFSMAIRGHETYMMTAVRLESESIPFFYAPWLHFRNDWCSRERGTQLCFSWLWTKKLCTLSIIKPIFKMHVCNGRASDVIGRSNF